MIPQPKFHPYLIPVDCYSPEDVAKLAEEMRVAATADPDIKIEYKKSEDIDIAEEKAKSVGSQWLLDKGHLRFLRYRGRMPANICFTLRVEDDFKEWNLSISHATPEGPIRVNDELTAVITKEFLGEDFQEVPPKAAWDTVRHFIKRF